MNTFSRAGLCVLLVLAIATGVWLNNTAWRNRRLIGQLQAAIIAGGVGLLLVASPLATNEALTLHRRRVLHC